MRNSKSIRLFLTTALIIFISLTRSLVSAQMVMQAKNATESLSEFLTTKLKQVTSPSFEFDESDIRNLNLRIKWSSGNFINANVSSNNKKPTTPARFVLLLEQKRLNLTSFLFDYSTPQLIDDGKLQ
jgi:hypothetical protein